MWTHIDIQQVQEQYEAAFAQYGYDLRSLFIPRGRQHIRFGALASIGIYNGASVLDVGCGFGHLYDYLMSNYQNVRYTGVDIVPAFIETAQKREPTVDFRAWDILQGHTTETWDFVLESGIFNLRLTSGQNQSFVEDMLRRMLELANVGVAADFMSTYVDYQLPNAFHADPAVMFQFCKSLSKRVSLRHDYMPYEFSVHIYKDDSIDSNNVFANHKSENYASRVAKATR